MPLCLLSKILKVVIALVMHLFGIRHDVVVVLNPRHSRTVTVRLPFTEEEMGTMLLRFGCGSKQSLRVEVLQAQSPQQRCWQVVEPLRGLAGGPSNPLPHSGFLTCPAVPPSFLQPLCCDAICQEGLARIHPGQALHP